MIGIGLIGFGAGIGESLTTFRSYTDKCDELTISRLEDAGNPLENWKFDETPASRSRRGGNPAEYAFEGDLKTFVREVVQNSNDQGEYGVEIEFSFIRLNEEAREAFFDAVRWSSLARHLSAVKESDRARLVGQYLDDILRKGEMTLLRVEDRNTVGLLGAEYEDTSHFTALCRDTLFSHKQTGRAGGSYGLGKSVLWSFSGISTVLFNSTLSEEDEGQSSPRLIGRTELPSHAVEEGDGEQWYTGSGWFGEVVQAPEGERAESIWNGEAEELAEELYLERRHGEPGTSILIVGFRDPTNDEDRSPEELSGDIQQAAVRYFWPAMTRAQDQLSISVGMEEDTRAADPKDLAAVRPFIDCYQGRHHPDEELEEAGDVVRKEIEFSIPAEREKGGDGERTGRVTLLVRLARRVDNSDLEDHVAVFRGPGMVVKYWDKRRLGVGSRPFHAVVIAGEGHDESEITEQDRATERFLRKAEPPGHDDWQSTKALKEHYKRGYATAVKNLFSEIRSVLRELVIPTPSEGERGPDKLRKRFQLAPRTVDSPDGASGSPFSFRGVQANFEGDHWRLTGQMFPQEEEHAGWEATFSLQLIDDDDNKIADLPLERLMVPTEGCESEVEGKSARIRVPSGVNEIEFLGLSKELPSDSMFDPATSGEVEVRIQGKLYEQEN